MQIAIVLYPGFTALDVIGPYEVLARLPGADVFFVAENPGLVLNDLGSLSVKVVHGFEEVPNPDVVLVGGGAGQADQMADGALHVWLRAVGSSATWMTSVCTGSLILAAAGVLAGRRATTHWGALEQLAEFGVTPSKERVVIDGHCATGAGVSAGIDMALTLAGLIAGDRVAQAVQLLIEYAPQPPYEAGSRDAASDEVYDALLGLVGPH
ncbi:MULTISPECIES: DJ-1/PfpI family protein [Streptomyces]|uniref:DJ-1/PfpI family protein n=1 Tax=Streptomyces TaxID=1883 RepID=UPI0013615EA9|nr:DJ-1/PfpI family protein [Streptomyces albidoflavus]MYX52745.1 DJ-1/PfpI family protein [Streptomyces sp. SID8385]WSD43789.1 DJ-1/PfpI family protein [Streptomyces albidoflavus]CAI4175379.1 ThiJ/PfpI domain-containing protein [Streptomyces albidoflavus]